MPPPAAGVEAVANFASCIACVILSADHLPFSARAATLLITVGSMPSTEPKAIALSSVKAPVLTLSNMLSGNRERGIALEVTFPPTLRPCRCKAAASAVMSRINLAASIAVPWPSAMFCKAPMARASFAVLAGKYRTKTLS